MARVAALDWDTEFWGRPSARVWPESGDTAARLAEALADAQATYQFVQLLLPLVDVRLIQAAEDAGFRYVDIRCLFDMPAPPPGDRRGPPTTTLEDVPESDAATVAEVAELAAAAHTISRFASDPGLDASRCADLYRRWIGRDAATPGWRLCVSRESGAISGYVTFGVDSTGVGAIGLIGVAERGRGRGLGQALARHATVSCFEQDAPRMTVVTQAGNAPAMALYRAVGFGLAEMGCWLHWHEPHSRP